VPNQLRKPDVNIKFATCCSALLALGLAAVANAETYDKSYSLDGRVHVQVHATFAMVRVTTFDESKVQFSVDYDKADWSTSPPISSRQDGSVVMLNAIVDEHRWWGWGHYGNHRLNIEVHMPRNADLQVETTNGAIDVSSLNGNLSIHTSNGHVVAQDLSGTIDIGSSNGAIEVGKLKGSAKVHTSNGAIDVTGADGTCELGTSNGRIHATGRFDSLDISSSNGSVVARAETGSKMSSGWSIVTSNSSIELSVPTDLKADLNASTSNGGIMLDLPVTVQGYQSRSQLSGKLNGGGPELSLHTSNASLRVRGI
jgi:Putative adhesin